MFQQQQQPRTTIIGSAAPPPEQLAAPPPPAGPDQIYHVLKSLSPQDLFEILAEFKQLVQRNPNSAKQLLGNLGMSLLPVFCFFLSVCLSVMSVCDVCL